ncbi:MAG: TIGR03747 family integrating conjugative element membrane protein [Candidatus Paceibacterota bacterium]|jgi:integrating conjugative element membrane protein (TIGR03747 family)
MADSVIQTPSRGGAPVAVKRGPVATLLFGLLGFAFWLVVGLFGNIVVECLCMSFIWPHEGPAHSQRLLEKEVSYLQQDLKDSVVSHQPTELALSVAAGLHTNLFVKTGITTGLAMLGQQREKRAAAKAPANLYQKLSGQVLDGTYEYLLAGMFATQVYALRLTVLFLSIPVFVLAGLVGAIDGIVQRDLNRWRGGRELGQRYHLAKSLVAPGLTLPWIIYLAWPDTVHPYLIILPFALFVGIVVAVTTSTFKKYF